MSAEEPKPAQPAVEARREPRFLFIDVWWWDALGGFFSVLGVIAALFGIFEYKQRVEASKASETLAMIDVWETRGARDAYDRLSDEVARQFADVPAADMQAAAKDPELARRISTRVAAIVLRDEANAKAFEDVVYFFNRLGLCVEAELCSDRTAGVFFEDTLSSFVDVFSGRIDEMRANRPKYAEAALRLQATLAGK